jgi:hypothetical protein
MGLLSGTQSKNTKCAQVGTARSLQRCLYSNNNNVEEHKKKERKKKERKKERKKTFWTQHGTNEQRQN